MASLRLVLLVVVLSVAACSAVSVRDSAGQPTSSDGAVNSGTRSSLSAGTLESLRTLGFGARTCERKPRECIDRLSHDATLDGESRLPAMAELQLADAHAAERAHAGPLIVLDRYIEVARLGFAYLFFVNDAEPEQMERMRNLYNLATERAATQLFEQTRGATADAGRMELMLEHVRVQVGRMEVRLPRGQEHPNELVPASRLKFDGVRNTYRRDGVGAAFVAVADEAQSSQSGPLREASYMAVSATLRFPGDSLEGVMQAREAIVDVCDSYQCVDTDIAGRRVPLAANFTAPYALWLSRSRFGQQGDRALLKRESALTSPRIYMLQPYDPKRRTVVLLHGLGGSPDAWVDLANDILGDDALRRHYQVWQVFYPTNLPIAENRDEIRRALLDAMATLDPDGTAPASDGMTLIGHSMGGVISRLLVVESGDALWQALLGRKADAPMRQRLALLEPYLSLTPMPQVDRIILLASPHRGSPTASGWIGRAASRLIRLPVTALNTVSAVADAIQHDAPEQAQALRKRQMDSVEALSDHGEYLRTTATLPVASGVAYHSIIGRNDPAAPLEASTDGVVPYSSSHLEGAMSELIVTSGHGVQETPEAILEVRRILRAGAAGVSSPHPDALDVKQTGDDATPSAGAFHQGLIN